MLNCLKPSIGWSCSDRFIQHFSRLWHWPSPQSFLVRLFNLLLLNFYLMLFWSKPQSVLLDEHIISELLNTFSKKPGSLLSCFLCVLLHSLGKKLSLALEVEVSVQAIKRVAFISCGFMGILPSSIFFLQEPSKENWFSYNLKKLSYSSSVICSECYRLKKPTTIYSLCSISGFTFTTSHIWLVLWLGAWKLHYLCTVGYIIVQVLFYCVKTAIYYLITIRAPSSSFTVTVVTLELEFLSLCLFAAITDCAKLIELIEFLAMYSTKRYFLSERFQIPDGRNPEE